MLWKTSLTRTDFNPLPPHGGRRRVDPQNRWHPVISIHSLRMEGDLQELDTKSGQRHFNPLPPHGGRPSCPRLTSDRNYFNPLPPHGGRLILSTLSTIHNYFNPLPPHGGRHASLLKCIHDQKISIHSLRMEGDTRILPCRRIQAIFQSTPSAWRETMVPHPVRSPLIFQSTPSAWRETAEFLGGRTAQETFQSTPSAWRETLLMPPIGTSSMHFNPLPPHGGRPFMLICQAFLAHFNPLPPHGGRLFIISFSLSLNVFQSTPSAWRETLLLTAPAFRTIISIHSLRMEGDRQVQR